MAFLDNSGDIILDAVLTDTGRTRLAKGDGTFKIVKFALGDDEIDYSLYQNANHADGAHASGSAYYDLNILMTPIFEAFTNNSASMKSKLVSIPRTNLLYMPVIKMNQYWWGTKPNSDASLGNGQFVVAVDEATEKAYAGVQGVIDGFTTQTEGEFEVSIRIDQGLDTTDISILETIDNDLKETQYIIEMDNRLGSIQNMNGADRGQNLVPSYIDDDHIASYYVSLGTDTVVRETAKPSATGSTAAWTIQGPNGTNVNFTISASLDLSTNTHLFTKLGGTGTATVGTSPNYNYKYIDTNIRVTGATTGASIDIPVRFVKND